MSFFGNVEVRPSGVSPVDPINEVCSVLILRSAAVAGPGLGKRADDMEGVNGDSVPGPERLCVTGIC